MAHQPPARFDPCFPLYYEDMDLCLRLAQQGAPVLWLPQPVIGHQRGEGSLTPSSRRLELSTTSYCVFCAAIAALGDPAASAAFVAVRVVAAAAIRCDLAGVSGVLVDRFCS